MIEGEDEEVLDASMDTGATECYMEERTLFKFADVVQAHDKPVKLRLFDGSPSLSGPLTLYVDLPLMLSRNHESLNMRFNITKLQGASIVLGLRWMAQPQASINLADGKITFEGNNLTADHIPSDSTDLKGIFETHVIIHISTRLV